MRINDEFEALSQVKTVVYLFRNGEVMRNTDGTPAEYGSLAEAEYAVRDWRALGGRPLIDLTDAELAEMAARLSR